MAAIIISGVLFLLGVLAVDLTIDLGGNTVDACHYYHIQRTAAFPGCVFIPAGIGLSFLPLVVSLIRSPRTWQHWVSVVLANAMLAVFLLELIPKQDQVAGFVKGHTPLSHGRAQKPLEDIRNAHLLIAAVLSVVVALQLTVRDDQGKEKSKRA